MPTSFCPGSQPKISCSECHVSHGYRVNDKVTIWYRGLYTDLLVFNLRLREKPQVGDFLIKLCDQSSPQMGYLYSKWGRYDRTACQGRRRKERIGKDRVYNKLLILDFCINITKNVHCHKELSLFRYISQLHSW